jgi:predicted DNA-binding protein
MKYQIYLNKETSTILNGIADQLGKKPSTLIKEFLEKTFAMAIDTIGDKKGEMLWKEKPSSKTGF